MSKSYAVVREDDNEVMFVAPDMKLAEAKLEELEAIEETKEVAHYEFQNALKNAGWWRYISSGGYIELHREISVKYGVEAPKATNESVYCKAEYWIDEVEKV